MVTFDEKPISGHGSNIYTKMTQSLRRTAHTNQPVTRSCVVCLGVARNHCVNSIHFFFSIYPLHTTNSTNRSTLFRFVCKYVFFFFFIYICAYISAWRLIRAQLYSRPHTCMWTHIFSIRMCHVWETYIYMPSYIYLYFNVLNICSFPRTIWHFILLVTAFVGTAICHHRRCCRWFRRHSCCCRVVFVLGKQTQTFSNTWDTLFHEYKIIVYYIYLPTLVALLYCYGYCCHNEQWMNLLPRNWTACIYETVACILFVRCLNLPQFYWTNKCIFIPTAINLYSLCPALFLYLSHSLFLFTFHRTGVRSSQN